MGQPLPAKSRFRLRLSQFLLLCAGIGLAIGVIGRSYVDRVPHRWKRVVCEGYMVDSQWVKTPLEREKLVYLVAFARGPIATGDYSEGSGWGFARKDLGLYLEGKKYSSPDRRGWVYSNYEGRWGKLISVPADVFDDFTFLDFEQLEKSKVWRTQFKPLLDKESATFAKMQKEALDPNAFLNRGGHKNWDKKGESD